MKTILCYGDSLTYGANPIMNGPRHAFEDRWPASLEHGLGGTARCIAEGLGGRTTVHDDWYANADRNGARVLPTLLSSHSPLDMVIVMLGTNDIKPFHGRTALEASWGMRRLVQVVRGHAAGEKQPEPKIILVAPPVTVIATDHPEMMLHFGAEQAIEASSGFAQFYNRRAAEEGVGFFDAGTVAKTDIHDGIHLDAANTRAIGTGLVPLVRQMLGPMTPDVTTRPARKSDAAEVALLVNIAVHGGMARGWANGDEAEGTYDPIEVGRLEMMSGDPEFGWEGATMAEVDGEIVGMLLGYRKPDAYRPVLDEVTGFMRPIEELEAEASGNWFINMLGVHVRWRSRGIGSSLLDVAEIKRRETGARGLALIIEDDNSGARRLYERRGFAVRTARPMVPWPGTPAAGRDWLLMVKD